MNNPLPPVLSFSEKFAVKFAVCHTPGMVTVVDGAVLSGEGAVPLMVQDAAQPVEFVEQSDRNSAVMEPPLEVMVPGLVVPVYFPIRGELMEFPSYRNK